MVRLNKIYTRTGDGGETGLADGSRIRKDDPLAQAIGDVDEANSAIGVALLHVADTDVGAMLQRVQNEMFDLGADIATPGEDFAPTDMRLIGEKLEAMITRILGVILAALAAQFVIDGLKQSFPGL